MALAVCTPAQCALPRRHTSSPPGMPRISHCYWLTHNPFNTTATKLQTVSPRSPGCTDHQTGAVAPRRIAIFVEPSPFTYVCGYGNRFTNTIRCLVDQGCHVLVITTGATTRHLRNPNAQTYTQAPA